jgi:hypothetical protein
MNQNPTVLLAEFHFNGGFERRYVATDTWYSKTSDSIGMREYLARITEEPTLRTMITCILWGGTSATTVGAMTLVDIDGRLMEWLGLETRDSECVLRLTFKGQSYDDSMRIARCIVDEVRKIDGGLQVTLRGRDTLLDKQLQSMVYDDSVPNEALVGTALPVALGYMNQIEPVVYDRTSLEYRLTDCGQLGITSVRSGGSAATGPGVLDQWDYNTEFTGFVMDVQPGARVLCDAGGGAGVGVDLVAAATAESRFDVPSNWTAGLPNGWDDSVVGTPAYTISEVSGVGLRFSGTSEVGESRTLRLTGQVGAGGWYLLVGKVARNNGGALKLLNSDFVIDHEGEFSTIWYEDSETDIQISHDPAQLGALDVTLTYLYAFSMDSSIESMTNMIEHLAIARGAFLREEIDTTTYLLSEVDDPVVGLYNKAGLTVREAVNRTMDSVTGWSWVGPDGVLRIGRLRIPNHVATPALTASRLNIVGAYPVFTPDDAPGLSDTYAGKRNWTQYTEEELAGITYTDQGPFMVDFRLKQKTAIALRRAYRHAIGAPPVTTYSQEALALQGEADRVGDIYALRKSDTSRPGLPGFWAFSIALPDDFAAAAVEVDQLIRLDGTNPYGENFFGVYHGLNAIIVDKGFRARNNVITLLVWTCP